MPNPIVSASLDVADLWSLPRTLWCLHVTETPEARSVILFNSGTPKGLNAATPIGGHEPPISGEGASLE